MGQKSLKMCIKNDAATILLNADKKMKIDGCLFSTAVFSRNCFTGRDKKSTSIIPNICRCCSKHIKYIDSFNH